MTKITVKVKKEMRNNGVGSKKRAHETACTAGRTRFRQGCAATCGLTFFPLPVEMPGMSSAPVDFLLIDVSNSFTKLIAATRDRLVGEAFRIPTPELTAESLRIATEGLQFSGVVLSCVVPKVEAAVAEWVDVLNGNHATTAFGEVRLLKISHAVKLGVRVDYPEPASIGADRLANAAGVALIYGAPAVAVDYGTALTFDIVAASPEGPTYVGGVIAPGLEAMTSYLHQRTALLPRIDLREPSAVVGKSTYEAMLSGAVYGYRGLVREILEQLRRELGAGDSLKVIATGGYAELISEAMPEVQHIHPNLTLEGLRIIGCLNLVW